MQWVEVSDAAGWRRLMQWVENGPQSQLCKVRKVANDAQQSSMTPTFPGSGSECQSPNSNTCPATPSPDATVAIATAASPIGSSLESVSLSNTRNRT
jgi:hypothetical protein